jgi:hypothetical protein
MENQNGCTIFLLLRPPPILSKINSNLQILRDFVFQINSDFISNLNLNGCGLLPHPYISSCAPPPRPSMPILPQNQTLAVTLSPPRHQCPSSLPPLFRIPPTQLNPVPVMRSQGPKHRRKTDVESQSVSSTIYRQSLATVSYWDCDFSGELEVNLTSPVSSPCCTLTPGLYGSEIGGL